MADTPMTESQGNSIIRLLERILEELQAIQSDVDKIERAQKK